MSHQEIIRHLNLHEHPEGGYYNEVYRSTGVIPQKALGEQFNGDRNYCTSIYFLLTSNNFSAFHRIKQDEIWNFYNGSPLFVHVIDHQGEYNRHEIGMDLATGQQPQLVVPANSWFASSVKDANSYSLVGCTVAPGFDFEDFDMAKREELIKQYPKHTKVIQNHTRQ